MSADRLYGPAPEGMPIPWRVNVLLVVVVFVVATSLLVLATRVDGLVLLAVSVLFSYVMLTGYALLHEAAHDNLHPDRRVNRALGVFIGMLFPAPFTAIRTTHQGHHRRNRTDHEMFDLYYATESRWVRRVQWYGTLLGFFWPLVPLGALAASLCPPLLRLRPFRVARSASYLLGDIQAAEIRAIRMETALIAAFFTVLVLGTGRSLAMLAPYACFAFNWSTRQYIGHAFTRRHVVEGALNLRHNALMTWVLLHGEWDLAHHRRPDVPWLHLPRLDQGDPRPGYVGQYLRLWGGPRLATEPAPPVHGSLSVHG